MPFNNNKLIDFKSVSQAFELYQKNIKDALSQASPNIHWKNDAWNYEAGEGGGITSVGNDDLVIEQAGVNFSNISGDKLSPAATASRPELAHASFKACGVSIIIHPHNPYVPTSHANFRLFMTKKPSGEVVWWFGGGFDLTPYYPFESDCILWHQKAFDACAPFGKSLYSEFKENCDHYFYLKHRDEPRGIGGLFFDDLNRWDFETCFNFIQASCKAFLSAYGSILALRKEMPYGGRESAFQRYRRGRYVEFNLLYDRGTQFGLDSGGRTESVLASLPPTVHWRYNQTFEKNTPEDLLVKKFLRQKDWISSIS